MAFITLYLLRRPKVVLSYQPNYPSHSAHANLVARISSLSCTHNEPYQVLPSFVLNILLRYLRSVLPSMGLCEVREETPHPS